MKPIFTEESIYKGNHYKSELFIDTEYSKLSPIVQVHAICFLDQNTVVFQKSKNGKLGNLGGGFEDNEKIEDVLKRELIEEGQLELVSWKAFGYERISQMEKPGKYDYFLRTVAQVKLLDLPVSDPCGKSIGRVIVPFRNSSTVLAWGEKGRLLLKYAHKAYLDLNI